MVIFVSCEAPLPCISNIPLSTFIVTYALNLRFGAEGGRECVPSEPAFGCAEYDAFMRSDTKQNNVANGDCFGRPLNCMDLSQAARQTGLYSPQPFENHRSPLDENERVEPLLDKGIENLHFEYEESDASEVGIQPQKSMLNMFGQSHVPMQRQVQQEVLMPFRKEPSVQVEKDSQKGKTKTKKKGKKGKNGKKSAELKGDIKDGNAKVLEPTTSKDHSFCHYPSFSIMSQRVKLQDGSQPVGNTKSSKNSDLTTLPKGNSLLGRSNGLVGSVNADRNQKKSQLSPLF